MKTNGYDEVLKRRVVQRFIQENNRSPNGVELAALLEKEREGLPAIEVSGLIGVESEKVLFKDVSSASSENANRQAMLDDLFVNQLKFDYLTKALENSFRSFVASANRYYQELSQLESRVDNLLLLNQHTDAFVYGFEEPIETHKYIDKEETTATVEKGYVTLGRTSYNSITLASAKIDVYPIASKGLIGFDTTADSRSLALDNGTFWEGVVTTEYQQGRVSLVVEITFNEDISLGELRLSLRTVDGGKRSTLTAMTQHNGKDWVVVKPAEQELYAGEAFLSISREKVRKVRVLLSKQAADSYDPIKRQYQYIYPLESIALYKTELVPQNESTVVFGPYEVLDELGQVVNFSRAALDYCAVVPDGTSISFSLSQDKEVWLPIDPSSNQVVVLATESPEGTYGLLDPSKVDGAVLSEGPSGIGSTFQFDGFLNQYLLGAEREHIVEKSIEVYRSIPNGEAPYGVVSGWIRDSKGQYSCTVFVEEPEGVELDLGSSSAYLNGVEVTGPVVFPKGYSTFTTNDVNWSTVDPTKVNSVQDLRKLDPAYPYNHRYLIEGFPYIPTFRGERVYPGIVSEQNRFGALMRYVSPEVFNSGSLDTDLSVYTIEEHDSDLYFKVKVDKQDSTWDREEFKITYIAHSDGATNLYVRADLLTTKEGLTPKLESFKVRVI